uniref:Non-specific phospholipase C6 n=1 Tax=Ananas comosus var. bracteatus TaxID=296719 RepID=A0A6V7P122_ANACO|nr:unnamed protein product [Ananas comosus var. bracteatus]
MKRTQERTHHTLLLLYYLYLFFIIMIILLLLVQSGSATSSGLPRQRGSPIRSMVVLVLENRSFDHMLGWLKRSLNPSSTASPAPNATPTPPPPQTLTLTLTLTLIPLVCVSDDARFVAADPGHSFEDVLLQVFGPSSSSSSSSPSAAKRTPSMSGFVEQALSISPDLSATVMKGFDPSRLPVFETLAAHFAVFDRWFSSIPGPTQPNRLFLYSATSHGAVAHDKWNLLRGYPQPTIFDSLRSADLDFGVYFRSIPTTLFYRNLRRLKHVPPRYFDLIGAPADDDHPSHDVANGQRLVKEVYETLRAGPQWNHTLLVVTYDEHGGFFDHVATPFVGVPNPDGLIGPEPFRFPFDRLGVRIPTIMVSPWIKKGTVVNRPKGPYPNSEFEHSSIPATIKKIFNLTSDFLTKRDAWAGTFEHIFTELSSPRTDCPEVLPEVTSLRPGVANEDGWLSEFQSELVQLAAVLNGDYFLNSFGHETGKKMTVKQADAYVKRAVKRFIQASKQAIRLGANASAIVNMRSALTTVTAPP